MIGTVLAQRYEILEKIGSGGMGEVFKAHDRRLDRIVAIKVLKSEYHTDENFVRKFRRESLAAASISHPNIVSIYDVGQQEDPSGTIHYIVMEYIEGKTLKEVILEESPLPEKKALNFTIQIAEALKIAHAKKIVHRDIKSQNIMVTGDNRVKVTDFGIARMAGNTTVTMTDSVMGSVHYFSPEQAKGAKVDHRSDIYSLGVVLYEMLTGDVPFDAENPVSVALMHIQEPIPSVCAKRSDLHPVVDVLLADMTAKNVKDRIPNVDGIISRIKEILLHPDRAMGSTTKKSTVKRTIPVSVGQNEALQEESRKQKDVVRRSHGSRFEDRLYDVPKEKNSRRKEKKRSSLGGTLLGILVALVVIGGAALFAIRHQGGDRDTVILPNVVGMQSEAARKVLEDEGLTVSIEESTKDGAETDEVIAQRPDANEKVHKNDTVVLVVNAQVETIDMPNLAGLSIDEARIALSRRGLELGKISSEFSDAVDEDQVVRTNPEADTKVAVGSTVDIFLSKGKEEKNAVVPNLIGVTKEEAEKYLKDSKLTLGDVKEEYNSATEGTVFYQQYRSGNVLQEGTSVDVKVSLGPERGSDHSRFDEDADKSVKLQVDVPDDGQSHEISIRRVKGDTVETLKEQSVDGNGDGYRFTVPAHRGDRFELYLDGALVKSQDVE